MKFNSFGISFSLGLALSGCAEPLITDSDCAAFSAQACMESAACNYKLAPDGTYGCQIAADHCESAFRQADFTQEQCEQRSDCTYVPARCFCPPDVTCVCSGGPPPACESSQP